MTLSSDLVQIETWLISDRDSISTMYPIQPVLQPSQVIVLAKAIEMQALDRERRWRG